MPVVVEHSKETYLAARIRRRRPLCAGRHRQHPGPLHVGPAAGRAVGAAASSRVAAAERVAAGRPLRAGRRRQHLVPLRVGPAAGRAVGAATSSRVAAAERVDAGRTPPHGWTPASRAAPRGATGVDETARRRRGGRCFRVGGRHRVPLFCSALPTFLSCVGR